jgi:hypothetical protein
LQTETLPAEDLLPVEYFHVVFTLPAEIARIAYWNKKAVYGLLFRASAETVTTPPSPCPHDRPGRRPVARRHPLGVLPPGLLPACAVLSRLFRRLFIEGLCALHRAGALVFFGDLARLAGSGAFAAWLAPFRTSEWVVSMPSRPSAAPRRCWLTSAATPTASADRLRARPERAMAESG